MSVNNMLKEIIDKALTDKRYDVITESAKIIYPDKPSIVINEYESEDVTVFTESDQVIHILCPHNNTPEQICGLKEAITTGKIYDTAQEVRNTAEAISGMTIPARAMFNHYHEEHEPKTIKLVIQLLVGKLDKDCNTDIDDVKCDNARRFVSDVTDKSHDAAKVLDNYLSKDYKDPDKEDDDDDDDDDDLMPDITALQNEVESISEVTDDNTITDDDYDVLQLTDQDGNVVDEEDEDEDDEEITESFISRRPKKLKPIPRDVVAYITCEMNAIRDANDQAMLSGYTCSKLELVDFYLNVIDTNDDRYIVPHTRVYLTTMQSDLNKLLTQILKIKPINRNEQVWRVNYPENWRG